MGFNSGFKGLNTVQHVSAILMSIIRSLSTAVAVSGLPLERGDNSAVGRGRSGPLERGDSSAVGRGRSGPTTTNNTAITTFER